jgi:ferritin-like metal-binding protein YciE
MPTDAKTIYAGALANTHAAEHQGLVQMKGQLGRLEGYPEYKALVEKHIATTEGQLKRIEAALEEAGGGTSSVKEAVTSTAGAIGAAVHGATGDPVLKDLYAGYAYQYHQIAAYQSLAVLAQAAGFTAHTSWIGEALVEEKSAAEAVAGIIEPVTRTYLSHASA